jgi:hypothetical protein
VLGRRCCAAAGGRLRLYEGPETPVTREQEDPAVNWLGLLISAASSLGGLWIMWRLYERNRMRQLVEEAAMIDMLEHQSGGPISKQFLATMKASLARRAWEEFGRVLGAPRGD